MREAAIYKHAAGCKASWISRRPFRQQRENYVGSWSVRSGLQHQQLITKQPDMVAAGHVDVSSPLSLSFSLESTLTTGGFCCFASLAMPSAQQH